MGAGLGAAVYSGAAPDLVYVVRPGDDNEELRFSLRSVVANMLHRKVWIVGHCPPWVTGVERIRLDPLAEKFANQRQSLTAAVNHPGVSDVFVLMNDDMYVVEPVGFPLPCWHLGPVDDYMAYVRSMKPEDDWVRAVEATADWFHSVNCYETHIPLLFDKRKVADCLAGYPAGRPLTPAGLYYSAGSGIVGFSGIDSKCTNSPVKHGLPFLSSVDYAFAQCDIGSHIRKMFPREGDYET